MNVHERLEIWKGHAAGCRESQPTDTPMVDYAGTAYEQQGLDPNEGGLDHMVVHPLNQKTPTKIKEGIDDHSI